MMRIATWNVNSLKARLPRVEEWIGYAQPDVLCMQETKLADEKFPTMTFTALGYDVAFHGEGRWNGVAIASRVGITDVTTGFDPVEPDERGQARFMSAECDGVRVACAYVPNGREVGCEHYDYKLEWLKRARGWLDARYKASEPLLLCGDINIAPEDRDVWSVAALEGATHISAPERDALARLCDWGLVDAFRLVYPDEDHLYSWWDYRAGSFHKGHGMRIDLLLVSSPLAKRVTYALMDRNARKGPQPSDHAPVFVDLA